MKRFWRSAIWRSGGWPTVWLVVVLVVGLLAPMLANDVPWCARVDGQWSFPAVQDLVGNAPPGPGDLDWKRWWARLPRGSADFAVMPPWPYGPLETAIERQGAGPSWTHPLGSDAVGRDQLARLLHGARPAVLLGGSAVLLGGLLGTLLGAFAGLRGGLCDWLLVRAIEVLHCLPMLLLLLVAVAWFGNSALALVLVMALLFWSSFARIVRGELLALREAEFVRTARALGVSELRLLGRHLLPQLRGQIAVTAAFCLASAVLAEAALSFLGFGPGTHGGSWGAMLRFGGGQVLDGPWHLWLFPALAIVVTAVACHALADRWRSGGAVTP